MFRSLNSLLNNILLDCIRSRELSLELRTVRCFDLLLAVWAVEKPEDYSWTWPLAFDSRGDAFNMEQVPTLKLNTRSLAKTTDITDVAVFIHMLAKSLLWLFLHAGGVKAG